MAKRLLLSVSMFFFSMFVFWYGGGDIFERGHDQAGWLVLSAVVGTSIYEFCKNGGDIGQRH